MNLNAKQWLAVALAAVSLGLAIWGVVLIVLLVAHAVTLFVKALILWVIASVFGTAAFSLFAREGFSRLWKMWN
jgi:hypothetical protein